MIPAPLPPDEARRLEALDELRVMHTLPEQAYDDLALVASRVCRTPLAMVSLVGRDQQWWKAAVGTTVSGSPRSVAFCAHTILEPDRVMVVPDAAADPRFHDNPLVTGEPGVRFYAGAPLVARHGEALGALCVVDREPRTLGEEEAATLRALARNVVALLESRRTIEALESRALEQQQALAGLEAAHARLQDEAQTDALTGVRNRRAFELRLAEEAALAARQGTPLALVMLDVDRFKALNDDFGHQVGDEVLATVGDLLARSSRACDLVFRYGGEEFAILCPHTALDGALVLAERFRRVVAGHAWPRRGVTASLGVAVFGGVVRERGHLLEAADAALYAAKRAGRNRVVHHLAFDAGPAR